MSGRRLAQRTVQAATLALVYALGSVSAHAEGLFSLVGGSWSGTGTISFTSGTRERIRCRANYSVGGGGTTLKLDLKCASDSYKFELRSDLRASSNSISGSWSEVTRNVTGSVTGGGTSERIDVTARSPTFSAFLTVATRGNRQDVTIQSPGSEMSEVAIALVRAGRR